ncbi:uncharacterized protein [Anoplolepis gracilipes]|uniref:uncharacterized protein n=1 Tax=Anoplolepis gracilipes TaxID=354296 RepID=UPI003B9E6B84
MGKSKKRSHSREKENKKLWKAEKSGKFNQISSTSIHPLQGNGNLHSAEASSHISQLNISGESLGDSSPPDEVEGKSADPSNLPGDQVENAQVNNIQSPTQQTQTSRTNQDESADPNKEKTLDLNEETLKIIGEEPPKSQKEVEIHSSLTNRWIPWLQQGLKKEVRAELLKNILE